jgi:plastocyanin
MKMRTRKIKITVFAAIFAAVSIAYVGCSGRQVMHGGDDHTAKAATEQQTAQPEQPAANGEVVVTIQDFVFKPAELTVAPGTKVTWVNKDEAPHTATSVDKKFNSGGLDTDDKFSFVFNDKGEYPYFCALHPQMKATVTVK